ncbi:MAG: hypothetical protein ACI9KK_001618 [Ascidiaceihabitans sp.]|jgi:hypothetical protein
MHHIVDQELGQESAKLFHKNLRHYVQNRRDNAGVDGKIIRDIISHEGKDIHEKVYRKPVPPTLMLGAVKRLPWTN